MEELFQPPHQNTRVDLQSLFGSSDLKPSSKSVDDFVPFYQERDKLGRLISRQRPRKDTHGGREDQDLALVSRRRSLQFQLSERNKSSDKTVEKMFKINTVRKSTSSRSLIKLKLAVPSAKSVTPQLGYYDAAQVADKMKVSKGSLIGLKRTKTTNQQQQKVTVLLSNKLGLQGQKKKAKTQSIQIPQKLELNSNLPELQNFHRMQKLQFHVKNNFEQDHLRFKDIMRSSLLLANQIRRELELD